MKAPVLSILVALVVLAVLPLSVYGGLQVASPQGETKGIVIGEIMPKPEEGEYEWLELRNRLHLAFMPLVMRNRSSGAKATRLSASSQESFALGAGLVDIRGWQVTDEDGNVYTIPDALPAVPLNAYVLIIFDGQGPAADDYDFGDNVAVLHSSAGLTDIFEDAADQASLYTSSTHSSNTIVDFVAWGEPPGDDAANAASADLWDEDWYASFQTGFGDVTAEDLLVANESLGRYPGSSSAGPHGFALYQASQLSPGAANPVPEPTFYTPEYGAIVETTGFSVSWSPVPGATGYALQLDDDPTFSSPLYDTTVSETYFTPPSPLAPGTYYWRIKAAGEQGGEGPWLGPIEIGIVEFPASRAGRAGIEQEIILGITPVRQNKDSHLLCLDGDPEGNPASSDPENAWDSPAPCTMPPCTDHTKFAHGTMYCVPASIRMMASHYGGSLSMDRIAYHMMQEWADNPYPGTHDSNPNNDLGHNRGWYYPDEESEGLSWALGTTVTAISGKPSFDDIKAFIDANRPIMFRRPGHMMVIDGYREHNENQFIHVLDPDQPPNSWRWQEYATQTIDGYWPGPATAPDVRSDEPGIHTDADGDGIMDWDEQYRFSILSTDADSDDDLVMDKTDMREYVFDASGNYSYRDPDGVDNDGQRKEADPDSDDGGSLDGCEDTNRNGRYEPGLGETSNFDSAQEKQCETPSRSLVGEVVHTIPAPGGSGVQSIAWDGSHLWAVVAGIGILRLDPQTGAVVKELPDPAPDMQDITWDGSNLWGVSFNTNQIYKLDPDSGAVLKSFPAPTDRALGLAWDGQYLWHTTTYNILYKLNPDNGQVLETIENVYHGRLIAWGDQQLWEGGDQVRRLDLDRRTDTMSFPCPAEFGKGVAWDGNYVWCAGYEDSSIYKINVLPGGATLKGRILKNGTPLSGIEVQSFSSLGGWQNRILLGKAWTDTRGEYTLPADLSIDHAITAWGDDSDPDQFRWMFYWVGAPQLPAVHAIPVLDAAYDGLLTPANGSSFWGVSPMDPIGFSWSPLPAYSDNRMRMAEASPYNEVWHSEWGMNTTTVFEGILDDGTQVQPGDYLWQSIFHTDTGWEVQSKYWYFTITAR